MVKPDELRTERLLLRRWQPADREPFAMMNADPHVMRYFSSVMSKQESDALVDRIEAHFVEHGFGLWAVEIPKAARFIGFAGLAIPRFQAHFTPCVEVGWRLAAEHWNRGYATEAAKAVLKFGSETLALQEIVSFTTETNLPSRRVMEKIGMVHNPADDFDLPTIHAGHPLRRHVLYRIRCSGAL